MVSLKGCMVHGLSKRGDGKRSRKALLGKMNEEHIETPQIILHQVVLLETVNKPLFACCSPILSSLS